MNDELRKYYESRLGVLIDKEPDLRDSIAEEIVHYFEDKSRNTHYAPWLVYALANAGRYPLDMMKDLSRNLMSHWSEGWKLRIIDREQPAIPDQLEAKTLYLVVLQDYQETPESDCPWICRALFVANFDGADADCRCILVWDGFPHPSHPPWLQFKLLLEDKRLSFQHRESPCEFPLGSRVYLALSGYLPSPTAMEVDSANLGQIVRGRARICCMD